MPDDPVSPRVKKVLIVDDNPDIIRILKRALEKEKYDISVAMDGEEALDKTIHDSPDLVILDLSLPKLSGEEVCKAIRKNEKLQKVRIIILTSRSGDVERIICRVIGADCYMTKPCDLTELLERARSFNA